MAHSKLFIVASNLDGEINLTPTNKPNEFLFVDVAVNAKDITNISLSDDGVSFDDFDNTNFSFSEVSQIVTLDTTELNVDIDHYTNVMYNGKYDTLIECGQVTRVESTIENQNEDARTLKSDADTNLSPVKELTGRSFNFSISGWATRNDPILAFEDGDKVKVRHISPARIVEGVGVGSNIVKNNSPGTVPTFEITLEGLGTPRII